MEYNKSSSIAQPNGSKGKGQDILPRFYYIIVKGKVPHIVSFLEEAIEDAGEHSYHEVFVTRDRLLALEFLNKKLQDDEVL
ncbi:uncharacterized protein ARMOST_03184 [Armillaria ostoyae]|uniref:Uncharacterized protein n=1 Tax=Armillaria ostoyae TaxID=47428 RepID=A0A284QTX5_ARMOS|nr:uncharacterized protein ARMOST_03184 [Armillaria ostoyae]